MSVGTVTNVRAVAQHHIVEDATVIWEDGLIVSVTSGGQPRRGAIDGRGAFCLPGLIDTHSDALEKEVNPRPGTQFPLPFALRSLEGRCLTAGITTVFHGVRFQENEEREASLDQAVELCETLKARRHAAEVPLDHYVLHRLDARSPGGVGVLETCLGAGAAGLVSIEDHTPGQGQFRDISKLARFYRKDNGAVRSDDEARAAVEERIALRHGLLAHVGPNRARLAELAGCGRIRLLAHDLVDHDEVTEASALGASVAEFPVSEDAARAARDAGLQIVMGAPNVVRGGSHSGNASAADLVVAGLCDGLASDYQPAAMLAAAFRLAIADLVSLPEAVALVTSGPAQVAGLTDRGRLEPGLRADLALVTLDGGWPTVRRVICDGESRGAYARDAVPA
ncbi:MAG: alpha-D-ribose 1-methylphosphonate 5-triphosphate diphosphatase [Acidimicrobiales bacterium]